MQGKSYHGLPVCHYSLAIFPSYWLGVPGPGVGDADLAWPAVSLVGLQVEILTGLVRQAAAGETTQAPTWDFIR